MTMPQLIPHLLDDFSVRPLKYSQPENDSPPPLMTPECHQDNDEVRFSIHIPGIQPSALDLKVEHGLLRVSGCCCTRTVDGKTVKRARYEKTFALDDRQLLTDVSKMKAQVLSEGLLVVIIPKKRSRTHSSVVTPDSRP